MSLLPNWWRVGIPIPFAIPTSLSVEDIRRAVSLPGNHGRRIRNIASVGNINTASGY